MTSDAQGNDITAIGVPVTGRLALAPYGTTLLTSSQGALADIASLMADFVPLGLLKEDGGPQFAWAASGDPIKFWQEGYQIPSGLADVTVKVTAGEILGAHLRKVIAGIAPDANSMVEIDGGGHSVRWVLYSEEIFKDGSIRRRLAPAASLKSSTEDQNKRGEVLGNALEFNIDRHADVNMKHFREWVLPPAGGATGKTGWDVTIDGTPTGGTFTLIVNGAATAPLAYNAAASAVAAAINALSGVTGITGVTASGTSPIAVTFPSAVTLSATSALTGGTTPTVTVA